MHGELLVIDDDRAIHQLISAELYGTQAQCLSAMNGLEGLQKAIQNSPTAILLDMDMPEMDGIEVCRRLKSGLQTRDIPIVFLTGDSSTKSKVQGIDLGAVDYVTKPFEPAELRARIRSAMNMGERMRAALKRPGIDELTGVWNRAYLIKQVGPMAAAAERSQQLLKCCLVSVDQLSELAGKMGQPSGADLIRDVAKAISATVRLEDVVGRYNTQTIAILGLTPDIATTRKLVERVQARIAEVGLWSFLEPEAVICSVGAVVSRHGAGPMILAAAEAACTTARLNGSGIEVDSVDSVETKSARAIFN